MPTLLIIFMLLAPAAGVASGLYTGGWRRLLVRILWKPATRRCGLANRQEKVIVTKKGSGEKVDSTKPVEHLPVLWGLLGKPIGPYNDRMGARWRVWAANGTTLAGLQARTAELAATTWCVRCVVQPRVARNGATSLRAGTITMLWSDPFRKVRSWCQATPGLIRPAFDIQGRPVELPIKDNWGSSWLIGAASGSGKSGWLNAIVAQLVQQPHIGLLGVDLKRVELSPWAPAFHDIALDAQHADRLLKFVRRWIDERMAALEAAGLKEVPNVPTEEWPYLGFVIDELGAWLLGLQGPAADQTKATLGEIAMLGRAAGLVIVAAIQRPTTDTLPGQFRDNIPRRVLLRVPTIKNAEAVLGWTPTQAVIDQLNITGLALLDLPGVEPYLARSCWGEIDDVNAITATHTKEYAA